MIAVLLPAAFHFAADSAIADPQEVNDILSLSHGVSHSHDVGYTAVLTIPTVLGCDHSSLQCVLITHEHYAGNTDDNALPLHIYMHICTQLNSLRLFPGIPAVLAQGLVR